MSNDFNFDSVVKKYKSLDITQKTKTELYKIMHKTAVSGWCGKLNENELDKKTISATQRLFS